MNDPLYPLVYVVVLVWNGKSFLQDCLSSLLQSDYPRLKVIVVDNGSTDNSYMYIKKHFPTVFIIKNKHNLGWSGGNNIGIRYSLKEGAEAIFMLNQDTKLEKNTITKLINILYSDPKTGIVGPKIYLLQHGKEKKNKIISFAGGYFTWNRYFGMHIGNNEIDIGQYDKKKETEFITGAAIMIKRSIFEELGLFNSDYFLYYEDSDFCMRVKKENYKIMYEPSAIVYHVSSGSAKIGSPLQNYYTTRNHYLFVEKNAPLCVKLREWLRTPKTIYEFMRSDDSNKKKYSLLGIRDYYLRKFGMRTYW